MRIRIIANTITADEKSLILHGPCTRQDLPGILTTLRPVGYGDDGIVREFIGITAPDGKTEIVTSQQQQTKTFIFHVDLFLSRLIIMVFATITKEMVFIIMFFCQRTAIDEIMAIDILSRVRKSDGQAT